MDFPAKRPVAPLGHHVLHVGERITIEQVVRIAAAWVIASVTSKVRPDFVSQPKRYSVRPYDFAAFFEFPVSVFIAGAPPHPAAQALYDINLAPESFFDVR